MPLAVRIADNSRAQRPLAASKTPATYSMLRRYPTASQCLDKTSSIKHDLARSCFQLWPKISQFSSGSGLGKGIARPYPFSSRPLHSNVEALGGKHLCCQPVCHAKRKRESPAAASRSRQRLQMWLEKKELARLMPELRTTPSRFAQQMRSTNLLSRMEGHQIDSGGSYVEALAEGEVESSVFLSNLTKTSLPPQLTKSPTKIMTPQQLTSPTTCQSCSQRMQQNV